MCRMFGFENAIKKCYQQISLKHKFEFQPLSIDNIHKELIKIYIFGLSQTSFTHQCLFHMIFSLS